MAVDPSSRVLDLANNCLAKARTFGPNLPINKRIIIPITGIIMVSGGHNSPVGFIGRKVLSGSIVRHPFVVN